MDLRRLDNRLDAAVSRALKGLSEAETLLNKTLNKAGRQTDLRQEMFSRLLYLYSWTRDAEKGISVLAKWQQEFPHSALPIVEGARLLSRCGHVEKALRSLEGLTRLRTVSMNGREIRTYFSGLHLKGLLELSSAKEAAAVRTLGAILKFAERYRAEIGTSFELGFVEALGRRSVADSKIVRYLDLASWGEFDAPVFDARARKLRRKIKRRSRN